ncbi:small GTPase [Aureococcus anophagefferens]|uniref:Small GTPase n=1 Tax=Aureococcus anophagefferens TaxID=44056 RepID=A0ABR1GEI5_AURAN
MAELSQKNYEFKIVLLGASPAPPPARAARENPRRAGDRGVGKTCLVLRFIEGLYNSRRSTIGAFFLTKKIVTAQGDACKIQIWDTAGQERFRAMAPMYYRNAAAAIVCFDVTDESTFNTMKDWVEELKTNVVDKNLVIAIACNKADLDTRQVSRARAEQFARSISAIVLDTSAKENFGVAELFAAVSEHVIKLRGQELCSTPGAPRGGGGGPGGRGLSLAARAAGFRDDQQSASSCSNC